MRLSVNSETLVRTQSTSTLILGALCSLAAGAAQPAEPVEIERTETVSATVESIDLDKRLVELRAGDRSTTVQVSPEVRNLAQVKVGDEVVVEYYQGLAAELRKKGESQTVGKVDATTGTARMPQGGQPGAAVGNMVTTTVVIEGVDRSTNSVTFTGPSGMTRTVDVKDPKAQKFIGTLKKGDEVELTYTEALAVTVEPQKK
jgi:hypothetical protein